MHHFVVGEEGYTCSEAAEAALFPEKDATAVDEQLVMRALRNGWSVLLSGEAGSGKSHLLQRVVARLAPENVIVCAPTGVAAYNVGGETLHRRLGLGLAEDSAEALWRQAKAKTKAFLATDALLVIDEISMLHPDLFEKLVYLRHRACGKPWQLLMVGDFLQLGPVSREKRRHIFDSEAWRSLPLVRIWLRRSFRHGGDLAFQRLLNHLRFGTMTPEDFALLHTRNLEDKTSVEGADGLEPLDVFPLRQRVEQRNNERLQQLATHHWDFKPVVRVVLRAPHTRMDPQERAAAERLAQDEKQLSERFPITHLTLAVGAQVMLRANLNVPKGLCNGAMGLITGILPDHLTVRFPRLDLPEQTIYHHKFRAPAGHTVDITLTQFPVTLAWASTIHKVQGLTLDSVRLDARDCFEAGQLYVAVARVRRLQDLTLLGFDGALVDARAVEFETLPL